MWYINFRLAEVVMFSEHILKKGGVVPSETIQWYGFYVEYYTYSCSSPWVADTLVIHALYVVTNRHPPGHLLLPASQLLAGLCRRTHDGKDEYEFIAHKVWTTYQNPQQCLRWCCLCIVGSDWTESHCMVLEAFGSCCIWLHLSVCLWNVWEVCMALKSLNISKYFWDMLSRTSGLHSDTPVDYLIIFKARLITNDDTLYVIRTILKALYWGISFIPSIYWLNHHHLQMDDGGKCVYPMKELNT